MHIPPYGPASRENHEPERPRKLLLKRKEIERLIGTTAEKGLTLVPTRLYFKGPYAKVEIALARGKDLYDKRRVDQGARPEARHRTRDVGRVARAAATGYAHARRRCSEPGSARVLTVRLHARRDPRPPSTCRLTPPLPPPHAHSRRFRAVAAQRRAHLAQCRTCLKRRRTDAWPFEFVTTRLPPKRRARAGRRVGLQRLQSRRRRSRGSASSGRLAAAAA